MERIGINDFRKYKGLGELTYSPDGTKFAFAATQSKENGKGYESNIYVHDIAKNETKQITSLGDSRTYFWADNNSLIFPGMRGDKKPGTTDFYKISLDGGEAKKVFTVPYGIGQVKKIDEDNFAFVAKYDHNKDRLDKMTPEQREEEKDYIIIDELPFWFNGQGFINKTRKVLYTYNISTKKVTQVSNKWADVMYVGIFGDKIFYTCTTYKDKKPRQTSFTATTSQKTRMKSSSQAASIPSSPLVTLSVKSAFSSPTARHTAQAKSATSTISKTANLHASTKLNSAITTPLAPIHAPAVVSQ